MGKLIIKSVLFRIIKKYLGINSFIHFDNDVLIYKNFNQVKNSFDNSKFNITPASEKLCIFGYSYIHDLRPINLINQKIIETAEFGIKHNWQFNYGKPLNEMSFIGTIQKDYPELFNLLPIFPYDTKYPFDPAGYGQFLDGTFCSPKKFYSGVYANINEYIGREIISKRIKVRFKNNKPQVIWKNQSFELVNLHIHSKRMNKFLPTNYKEIYLVTLIKEMNIKNYLSSKFQKHTTLKYPGLYRPSSYPYISGDGFRNWLIIFLMKLVH